jgi:hypothetical protein
MITDIRPARVAPRTLPRATNRPHADVGRADVYVPHGEALAPNFKRRLYRTAPPPLQSPGVPPITASPAPDITALFTSDHGWTGGDAAYSVPTSHDRTLWFFGDSFIGDVSNGQRSNLDMVHNADAVQIRNGPLTFGWRRPLTAQFTPPPDRPGFYWPGYGVEVGDKVFLFEKYVERDDTPMGFKWPGVDVVCLENPQQPQAQWRYTTHPLPGTPDSGLYGTAGVRAGSYLYLYGIRAGQALVARTPAHRLPATDLTYWTGHDWSTQPEQAAPLFDHAATEMSVCQVPGRAGYYAVYTEGGLGSSIVVRHADTPQGPWSDAQLAYTCPESGVYTYAAKAHPELSKRDGELVVTYCCNPPDFSRNMTEPDIYRPKGVRLQIP